MQEQQGNEETGEADMEAAVAVVRQPWKIQLLDVMFPQLSLYGGRKKCSRRHSTAVLAALYASHTFSAWGDRMWHFLVALLLATLYPGSLLLPAVFGLVQGLLAALLGTMLGDWVDRNPRMKVIWMSLLIQNGLVCLCAVVLALLFGRELGICDDVSLALFILLAALTILIAATANLATVANTIAIEKDWVVVIADKNKDTLATLNANMRRIDLVCKLLAPAVAGVILQFMGPLTTTIIVATWNVVSFVAELGLVVLVYRWVPTLAVKKFRKRSTFESLLSDPQGSISSDPQGETSEARGEGEVEGREGNLGEEEEGSLGEQEEGDLGNGGKLEFMDEREEDSEERELFSNDSSEVEGREDSSCHPLCVRLLTPYVSLRDGWTIYFRQQIALAGIALATIYLTVLGFSGVTATYFLTQGLPNSAIGAAQGTGAIVGLSGTIAYPYIRSRIGTVRTGMFGISCQLSMLVFCAVAVLIPGNRIANEASGYYSAHCPADEMSNNSTTFCTNGMMSSPLPMYPTPTPSLPTTIPLLPTPTPSQPTPIPTHNESSGEGSGDTFLRPMREATGSDQVLTSPTPCTTSTPSPSSHVEWEADRVAPLAFMLVGVILARFGLWIFDLSVQQLVQETVIEEERGVVGGVMNAMNYVMDMLHYVLVIAAPRPEHFLYLTLISVGMVTLGALFYAIYLRRVRGHFFHTCYQYYQFCRTRAGKTNGHTSYKRVELENEDQTSLINETVVDNEDL